MYQDKSDTCNIWDLGLHEDEGSIVSKRNYYHDVGGGVWCTNEMGIQSQSDGYLHEVYTKQLYKLWPLFSPIECY